MHSNSSILLSLKFVSAAKQARNAKIKFVIFLNNFIIGFPAHFRHLFIQFHQFSIQFRPKKLTAFKYKVQFRQIVIHIRFCQSNLTIQHSNSSIVTEIRPCR